MGQALQKLLQKKADPATKQKEELRDIVTTYVDQNYEKFQAAMKTCSESQKENMFFHFIYETIGEINAKIGAMQYKLPKFDEFHNIFKQMHPDERQNLTKEEFRRIIDKLVGFENVYLGQEFKDIALYTFGFPVVALFAKRLLLGSASAAIPDEFFIPAVTSATVVYLAKKNKL